MHHNTGKPLEIRIRLLCRKNNANVLILETKRVPAAKYCLDDENRIDFRVRDMQNEIKIIK